MHEFKPLNPNPGRIQRQAEGLQIGNMGSGYAEILESTETPLIIRPFLAHIYLQLLLNAKDTQAIFETLDFAFKYNLQVENDKINPRRPIGFQV